MLLGTLSLRTSAFCCLQVRMQLRQNVWSQLVMMPKRPRIGCAHQTETTPSSHHSRQQQQGGQAENS